MFYPATSHPTRTYGAPTTGRRKLAVHNENNLDGLGGRGLPSKTPSRAGPSGPNGAAGKAALLGSATVGRVGLGQKTEGKDRNVLSGQPGAGVGKGKGKEEEIEPKRLFASTSTLPPSKSLSNLPFIPTKTPARPPPSSRKLPPNKTPAPSTFRIAQDVSSTPLPSATRRRRSRSSNGPGGSGGGAGGGGGGATPMRPTMRPAEEFRTPLPSAKWQDGDGEGDSPEGSGGLEVQGTGAEGDVGVVLDVLGEVEEESEDEVEYMPPKPDELPYELDWEPQLDIISLTRQLQTVPCVAFDTIGEAPELSMEVDTEPRGIMLESDDKLEDPIFQREPAAGVPSPPVRVAPPASGSGTGPVRTTSTTFPRTRPAPPAAVPATSRSKAGTSLKSSLKPTSTFSRSTLASAGTRATAHTRPPLPSGWKAPTPASARPAPPALALSARSTKENIPPLPTRVNGTGTGLGSKKGSKEVQGKGAWVEEDDELMEALMLVGGQEAVFDLDLGLDLDSGVGS
ncbi:uncharacterized protein MKK02DRAFT_40543 [Dioszegia hungarica]|uniref:Uncharacterized protein n=1 Tax=Dioszegia hungarica TaxID=4972 RepID=A0AA38H3T9_9TREE|nr:uncharacterized protein MKK02DRAFT_40543 [Dioszegia hungarica]KAI9632239.1 hypothetical protein MKK02DRAFT_40543 [Dioszegia hungarica]